MSKRNTHAPEKEETHHQQGGSLIQRLRKMTGPQKAMMALMAFTLVGTMIITAFGPERSAPLTVIIGLCLLLGIAFNKE